MKRGITMRLATLLVLIAGALVFSSTSPEPACAAVGTCGVKPIKPIPPLGCKDLCAQCQCNATGTDCNWVWVCCG
jgi:hypothetical protein